MFVVSDHCWHMEASNDGVTLVRYGDDKTIAPPLALVDLKETHSLGEASCAESINN